ncbi:hypothetical protein AUEXF2481DRAFT_40185 [Aureobasidium subglaciale EXF-2481]|uniref:Uncharacterized protein n=1 Tax=Aureobasidium subglaciale (strain EXF-2481) TaxID=1043005 RepID=A0A074YLE5_AURSE|nr:uncharacterized protein AUEXF2481DRAFT_40185 [Aureobasidium subglaciale EXF-2481]KEQ94942.1 hypothetical protein AUEXF2481DRAFT_40185 [Aureobasidium subglaciale EXF-2481]
MSVKFAISPTFLRIHTYRSPVVYDSSLEMAAPSERVTPIRTRSSLLRSCTAGRGVKSDADMNRRENSQTKDSRSYPLENHRMMLDDFHPAIAADNLRLRFRCLPPPEVPNSNVSGVLAWIVAMYDAVDFRDVVHVHRKIRWINTYPFERDFVILIPCLLAAVTGFAHALWKRERQSNVRVKMILIQ